MTSEFDWDRPTCLRPDDWEYGIVTHNGSTILISKVGGGTLGETYTGSWHWSWTHRDRHQCDSDLITGSPTSHASAANQVDDFITEMEET
jgi:hypothetical protein